MKYPTKASKKTHIHEKDTPPISELRQDAVSGDWVLIAPSRLKRPEFFAKKEKIRNLLPKSRCPFENPQKSGNAAPMLVYQKDSGKDWFLQVISNKYPAVGPGHCGVINRRGHYVSQAGTGNHEIVIMRDHDKHLAQYTAGEIKRVLSAYQDRYRSLAREKCINYISIFHNHGREAGASVPHPHSQILTLPVVPPDVGRSIDGSKKYFHKNRKCIHCAMLADEIKDKKRIVFENKMAIVFAPFASHSNFELRIFPKKHEAHFEKMDKKELTYFAEALRQSLRKIYKGLKDPSFNFFIHTAPTIPHQDYQHYHWHIEILPKVSIWGGFELGTGIDIVSMSPEATAAYFKKI
ncbi:hypothetical protein A2833_00265 [Candidatus Azambacteria bacterium RIFCSPHIGHO2_01_FULL_44_55]|uniref:Galactose-1-phosphate uridyl transferase N-terminal domain-containing protein n=1 Tax=Candidatus Azambacteria bacterium RIFCSPLOWO2_02_FULL_44_14 TaxID=1797306 RepID=A0A1F5CBL1_9BACT|nr:MAG: hypothetical protein A3A18_00610 [Candidatus Azambacteria bacterium RIFCSPLOWO2_01_FULL_44_84]OGD32846.1 MAG: hypothetical protein A3C78_03555 [Candidatus Azambacteria bacterium RIFCSPHIGHO2_02_FULL_45_18]OGD40215.1 MAG: hypothetical protein A3I30_03035 [Candidatus Azambacteria bacterium RIFCSPLOWO2_02_FULL_44_14]OGD41608.1 MAG: hypothetical protein A2833_00265 [Candidatus Azambacteria bacterium RIFCSPHIGHO2_01_FULL_44_55]OGD51188.1 MAG: hypothetical protein A2608_01775 [Candidatus Azam